MGIAAGATGAVLLILGGSSAAGLYLRQYGAI